MVPPCSLRGLDRKFQLRKNTVDEPRPFELPPDFLQFYPDERSNRSFVSNVLFHRGESPCDLSFQNGIQGLSGVHPRCSGRVEEESVGP